PETPLTVARGEIAQNGVGFPHRGVAVANDRNAAMGIHGEKSRIIEPAEAAAAIDMLVRQFQLADQPHHLLAVERAAPLPDLELSRFLPLVSRWLHPCAACHRSCTTCLAARDTDLQLRTQITSLPSAAPCVASGRCG